MTEQVGSALLVSLQVALVSTTIGMVPATLLAYVLSTRAFPGKQAVTALTGLPLVLPPTAVGYLLLESFAVDGPLGRRALGFDPGILMTWKGAVVATMVMSFPLIVRTARVAFEGMDPRIRQVASTLGHSPFQVFYRFTLPLARRGLAAAAILGFTRALGEFGASVTIAGNIPGQTSTLAAAIWSAQEMGAQREAHLLIMVSVCIGLCASFASEALVRSSPGSAPFATSSGRGASRPRIGPFDQANPS